MRTALEVADIVLDGKTPLLEYVDDVPILARAFKSIEQPATDYSAELPGARDYTAAKTAHAKWRQWNISVAPSFGGPHWEALPEADKDMWWEITEAVFRQRAGVSG